MHAFLLLWWAARVLYAQANGEISLNDEGPYLESIPLSDDLSSPSSTQDPSVYTSLATDLSGEDIAACLSGTSGFFGRKRTRSNTCTGDQSAGSDPEPEEFIRDLGWNDDDPAIAEEEGVQPADICPDPLNLGHVLPVCSSGYQGDISYSPMTGEVRLDWCTLGLFQCFSCPCKSRKLHLPDSNST